MLKRLIRTNITLTVVIVISVVISLGLFGLLFQSYIALEEQTSKIDTLRRDMSNLSKTNTVSPARENLELLESDRVFYSEKLKDVKNYFGQPYREALAAAAAAIYQKPDDSVPKKDWDVTNKAGDVDSFTQAMIELLTNDRENATDSELRQALSSFAIRYRSEWDAMASAFQKKAQESSIEKITDSRLQDFFLVALGFQRLASGDVLKTQETINEVKKSLSELARANNVAISSAAVDFAMVPAVTADQIAGVYNNIGIASDLSRRVIGSGISGIDGIVLLQKEPDMRGDFGYFSYRLKVHGTQESLRKLFKTLTDAYSNRRIYWISSVKIERNDGEAELIRRASEGTLSVATANPNDKNVPVAAKIVLPDPSIEQGVEMAKRQNYGVPVLGRDQNCFAEIDVAYVIYMPQSNKSKGKR